MGLVYGARRPTRLASCRQRRPEPRLCCVGDLLGPNFLQFLLLALAGALVVGNALALVRPPPGRAEGADSNDLERAPLVRSLLMLGVGLIVVVWILASLLN